MIDSKKYSVGTMYGGTDNVDTFREAMRIANNWRIEELFDDEDSVIVCEIVDEVEIPIHSISYDELIEIRSGD